MIDISAVVLSFNSQKYIETCIRSLLGAISGAGLNGEVHVIENGSADGSAEILRKLQGEFGNGLIVRYLERNIGTTRSRNIALKQARGGVVLVLDSDALIGAETLRALVDYLDTQPGVGLVAPRLVYPSGNPQLSVDVFPTVGRKLRRYFGLRQLERCNRQETFGAVDYAISACWLLRKEAVTATGYLDEKIFYSPEDVDYCIRLWKAGYAVHYLPNVSVVHDAQEISRPKGFGINKFTVRHAVGLAYLFRKHGYMTSLAGLYRRIGRGS